MTNMKHGQGVSLELQTTHTEPVELCKWIVPAPAVGVAPVVEGVPVTPVVAFPPGAQGFGNGCVFSCPCCWPAAVVGVPPAVNTVRAMINRQT